MPNTISKVGSSENTSSLVTRTASAAHDVVDVLASKLSNTEDKLRNVASESSQCLTDSQERARVQMKKSMQAIKLTTRKNPLIVAGAAFAIGAIVVALFSSNRD